MVERGEGPLLLERVEDSLFCWPCLASLVEQPRAEEPISPLVSASLVLEAPGFEVLEVQEVEV